MFLGEYLHTFDAKNRISLPSRFRKALGSVVIVTRGLDHCLYLYARKAWEKEAATYAARASGSATERKLARLFLSGAFEAEVDSTGRILVPEHLKHFANIKTKVVIAGVFGRLEMWDEEQWRAYTESIEREAETLAN